MQKEYDFSKGKPNPYYKPDCVMIAIQIKRDILDYYKQLARETGMDPGDLINSYLAHCAINKLKPVVWPENNPSCQ